MRLLAVASATALWLTLLAPLTTTTTTHAKFPPNSGAPYYDTCRGVDELVCTPSQQNGQCAWFTDQYPWCFSAPYARLQPQKQARVGLSTMFFTFHAGVHLSEGTHQKIIYNLTPDECAAQCLKSAGMCPKNVRCLSFDFYPFETPLTSAPWFESPDTGICVLNDENKDSARLRNSDLGYSDTGLYYRSHFSYLPFSDNEGYYEIRNPRGGGLAYMLDYGMTDTDLPPTINVWGGSRWGIFHYAAPQPVGFVSACPFISANPPPQTDYELPRYFGGYTPVDEYQHCPGLVSFDRADELCANTGGRLCTPQELELLRGVKLGCGFDGPVRGTNPGDSFNLRKYPLWSESDRGKSLATSGRAAKYPRCCANYAQLDSCFAYKFDGTYCDPGSNEPYCPYSECSKFKLATDCINYASGTAKQRVAGMGIYLDEIRQNCTRDNSMCKGWVVQDWAPRDQCVWCPTEGGAKGGGSGECRAGSSLAVCKNAPELQRQVWANTIRTHDECQPVRETICRMAQNYPDLIDLIVRPTMMNTTRAPTFPGIPPPFCRNPDGNLVTVPPSTSPPPVPFQAATSRPTPALFPVSSPSKKPTTLLPPTRKPTTGTGTLPTKAPAPVGGAGVSSDAPTTFVDPSQPCYTLQNTPPLCQARPDCVYDVKRKLCLVRRG